MAVLVGVLTLSMMVSSVPFVEPASAAPTPAAPAEPAKDNWVEPTGTGAVRPDVVSASVTARSSGQRVEVLSERTGTSRTWALPSGLMESEVTAAPARFEKAGAGADGWVDIDTTLVAKADGTLAA